MRYFLGYRGDGLALLGERDRALIVNRLYEEEARNLQAQATVIVAQRSVPAAIRSFVGNGRRVGIQNSESLYLATTLRKAGFRVRVLAAHELRTRKTAEELATIKRAYEVIEGAFEEVIGELRAGQTEREIAGRIVAAIMKRGGEGTSFDPVVAIGENASLPHALPGARTLEPGDLVLFDIGARVDGYCSDITRCVLFGKSAEKRRLERQYVALREAQDAALEMLADGERSARAIDEAARALLRKRKLGSRFIHGLGHGIGLEVHESPTLGRASKDMLADNMAFTIEPGVYFPGRYGLRLEDAVYLSDGNPVFLTTLPRELLCI